MKVILHRGTGKDRRRSAKAVYLQLDEQDRIESPRERVAEEGQEGACMGYGLVEF